MGVIVLDFGSQTTQLICRRIRELGVYSEIKPWDTPLSKIGKPDGIILSGGPKSVLDADAPVRGSNFWSFVEEEEIPVLGICYGMQMMAKALGGEVAKTGAKEYGKAELKFLGKTHSYKYFGPLDKAKVLAEKTTTVWFSHGDSVAKLPKGFERAGTTNGENIAVMEDTKRNFYGVQFHPEVTHTEYGTEMLDQFLNICLCQRDYDPCKFIDNVVEETRSTMYMTSNGRAICALSGGVDSTVAAMIAHRAIGDKLKCIYVDTGYMRLNESDEIMAAYKEMGLNVLKVDASAMFYRELKGVTDPEQKRKIIGKLFIETFEEAAKIAFNNEPFDALCQGSIYPDFVESGHGGTGKAVIKSHHNVGGLPEKMNLKVIEPLKELFKDEVRKVGKELGVPDKILNRHPFPGPGLAIRILGEATPEDVKVLQQADFILREEVYDAGLTGDIWQLFAVLLPVRSVGVQGDERTYGKTCVIRAVQGDDAMSMNWYRMPYDVLEKISTRITNEVKEINRVVYDVSNKPPATIEWE